MLFMGGVEFNNNGNGNIVKFCLIFIFCNFLNINFGGIFFVLNIFFWVFMFLVGFVRLFGGLFRFVFLVVGLENFKLRR